VGEFLLFKNVVGRGIFLLAKFEELLGSAIKERTKTEKKPSWRNAKPPCGAQAYLST